MSERDVAAEARQLLLDESHGVLGTISEDIGGYPFGSVVPYCLDRGGLPVILISRLAQHTKNLAADPRCCLTVLESGAESVQAGGRLTWIGDIEAVAKDDEDTASRYCRYFPEGVTYATELDFDFFRIRPVKVRYIGGFGRIHWVGDAAMVRPSPFSREVEDGIVTHMNEDHVDAMRRYCALVGADTADHEPCMAGVDDLGVHLRVGEKIVRIRYSEPATHPGAVRAQLVALARRGPGGD